jgi:hypothetical protein
MALLKFSEKQMSSSVWENIKLGSSKDSNHSLVPSVLPPLEIEKGEVG